MIWVIASHDNNQLDNSTTHAITAASQLGDEIHLLIAGYQCAAVVEMAKCIPLLTSVTHCDSAYLKNQHADNMATLIVNICNGATHILAAATSRAKATLPRVAAQLDVTQASDVISIIDKTTVNRPLYAGNVIATQTCQDSIVVMTIRQSAFSPCAIEGGHAAVHTIGADKVSPSRMHLKERIISKSDRPSLSDATIVVSGGRGLGDTGGFDRIEALASKWGAAVGATRAVVDAGWVPNEYQVGQTGQVVAPALYIAFGISGAIQHVAGMSASQTIIAINNDPDAPIFQIADFGLVANCDDVLSKLEE